MKNAFKGGVLNPFKKLLKQYWTHWRKEVKEFKPLLNDKVKQLLIKAYKAKVREAWTKMNVQGAKKRKKKKMVMNEEMSGQNQAVEDEIAQIKEKVATEEVRNKNKGKGRFKKMLLKAYKAELKYRLHQWKARVDTHSNTGGKVEKTIIKKMKNRFLRQAFDRLKAGSKRVKQMERNEDSGGQLAAKLKQKRIRKVFDFFCANKARNKEVRAQVRHVFTNFNKKVEKHYFLRWQAYLEHKTQKKLRKKRMAMTDATQGSIDAQGVKEDELFEREKETKELVRKGVSLSRKTLAKTIARWRRGKYYEAFSTWKERTRMVN